jgi:hypothetical protein
MITLIATGHRENGNCSSNELLRIIEAIAPDLIFEEIPGNKHYQVYSGMFGDSLESKAIKSYLKINPILHFPVDLEIQEERETQLRNKISEIQDFFTSISTVHRNISKEHRESVEISGFSYLNSKKCEEFLKQKLNLEKEIVKMCRDMDLSKDYYEWLSFMDEREDMIINNVYNLSKLHKFNNAILWIGAEHRKPLKDKIEKFEKENNCKLNWRFNYFEN